MAVFVYGSEIALLVRYNPGLARHFERLEPLIGDEFARAPLRPPLTEPTPPKAPYPLLERYTHSRAFAGRDRDLEKLADLVQ